MTFIQEKRLRKLPVRAQNILMEFCEQASASQLKRVISMVPWIKVVKRDNCGWKTVTELRDFARELGVTFAGLQPPENITDVNVRNFITYGKWVRRKTKENTRVEADRSGQMPQGG